MAVDELEKGGPVVSLAECKAYLRIERDDDDAVLAGLLRTATGLCEAFVGQLLMVRAAEQRLAPCGDWQRLRALPMRRVLAVLDGEAALPAEAYEADVSVDGLGWVRLLVPADLAMPRVRFEAGLAESWNDVPEPLRHGIVRLTAHLFTHRDAAEAGPPPAAVAALWRPWRRLSLG
jgi:uncharacterized phiE125 gp8 family phage protein